MGLLNYLGGRGSSAFGEGSSRHVESDVGGVTVALEEEKSWEQPDPSVDNVPFTSFDEARPSDSSRRRSSAAAERDHENVVDALERDFTQDAKRFVVIVTCMTAMVLLVNSHRIGVLLHFNVPNDFVHTDTRANSAATRSCYLLRS